MARPPEPLEQLLREATWIVEAEVEAVLFEAPPPPPKTEPRPSAPNLLGAQRVRLKIERVLRGEPLAGSVEVEKPEGSYLLDVGNRGPFFLAAGTPPKILGRYGPDTHSLARIQSALTR